MYNATTKIEFLPSDYYVRNYHSVMYDQEEQLLDVFLYTEKI